MVLLNIKVVGQIAPIGQMMDISMPFRARYFLFLLLLLVQPSYANSSVVMLGSFSNQHYSTSEDPHIDGYSLTLYREGEIVFGRFCWATGIEVPCAPIQMALIDKAGRLTFQAKLSIGKEISKDTGPQGRPAFRLIEFRGEIRKNSIPGVVSIRSIYTPHAPAKTESVKLKRVPYTKSHIPTYQEWTLDPLNKPLD